MHIYDAMNIMAKTRKRCAKLILATQGQVKMHATNRGMDENRQFVQSAITNKQRRKKKVYYHAKMRSGMVKCDTSKLLIRLEIYGWVYIYIYIFFRLNKYALQE